MPTVPFLNLRQLFDNYSGEFLSAINETISASAFIDGPEVERFQQHFTAWLGDRLTCATCGNGTDALTVAAQCFEVPTGSEAIIPAFTFVATAEALVNAGYTLRLIDVTEGSWLMDVSALRAAISSKIRLVVPVHLYGQMAPVDEIRDIASQVGAYVLEDAAQAHGAKWKDKSPGHWGHAACFSFYPGKNLGAFGDGGAIVSNNTDFIRRCSMRCKHGGLKKYEHLVVGMNSRLDGIQAAILNVKLKYIDSWNARRREIAKRYMNGLANLQALRLPKVLPDATHVFHLFVVLVEDRHDFAAFLKDRQIETGIHYPHAIHQLAAFEQYDFAKASFPNAEKLASHGVSLPMCPILLDDQIDYVISTIGEYYGK